MVLFSGGSVLSLYVWAVGNTVVLLCTLTRCLEGWWGVTGGPALSLSIASLPTGHARFSTLPSKK